MVPLDAILQASDLVAVLGRELPVRLLDISASGCLLECASRIVLGATGSLVVTFEGQEYADDIRIMRCRQSNGGSAGYHVGAEFLWTKAPDERSLRRMVTRLQASAIKSGSFGVSTQM
jgi:c-di-GMP-binding flagellar brake protein YcgR